MKLLFFTILLITVSCSGNSDSKDEAASVESPTEEVAPKTALDNANESAENTVVEEVAVIPLDEQNEEVPSFDAQYLGVPNNASYGESSYLLFQLLFDTPVDVSGSPSFSIRMGSQIKKAYYHSGSASDSLEFRYIVEAGDNDSDGIEILGLSLNGGTIENAESLSINTDIGALVPSMSGVLINTSFSTPDQVSGLAIAPTTNVNSLSLTWSVPNGNGNPISGYLVQSRKVGVSAWSGASTSSNVILITGLEEGEEYQFRVAANNGILGAFSNIEQASAFNILALNPIAWLDATDPNGDGTLPNNGDLISSWVDKTGQASAAEEPSPANQPVFETNALNGLPAIRFDDKAVGLQGTFTRTEGTDLTIIIIGQFDEGSVDKCLFEFNKGSTARAFFIDRRYANNSYYDPDLTRGRFNLWKIENKGAVARVSENDNVIFDDTINFNTDFLGEGNYVLGDDSTGGNRLKGYIGEILIFDRELSADDMNTLTNYLRNKWAVY
jgi:hypothetical protein